MDKHDVVVAAIGVAAGVAVGVGTTLLVQNIKVKRTEKKLQAALTESLKQISQTADSE